MNVAHSILLNNNILYYANGGTPVGIHTSQRYHPME